jgi:hypothetical protein
MKSNVISRERLESDLLAQGLHPSNISDERLAEFKLPPPDEFSRLLTPEDAKWRNVRWKWWNVMMRCYRNVSCGDIESGAGDLSRGVAIALVLREQLGRLTPGERLSKRMEYESVAFELWTRRRLQPQWARWLRDLEHRTLAESPAPYAVAIVDHLDAARLRIVDVDADLHAARIAEVWHRSQSKDASYAESRLHAERSGGRVSEESLRVEIDEEKLRAFYDTLGQATRLSYFHVDGSIRASAERWKSAFDRLDGGAHRRHVDRNRRAKQAQDRQATPALDSGVETIAPATAIKSRAVRLVSDISAASDVRQSVANELGVDALEVADSLRDAFEALRALLPSASRAERAIIEAWLVDREASLADVANRSGIPERRLRKARESIRARLSKKIQI